MKIGILQCGHAAPEVIAEHGDYDSMFARLLAGHGFDFKTWNVVDMEFPPAPDAADGWLLSGSRHGVYEDHPFIPPLEDFIRAAHAARMPMVGVCFGHQIIARALGGQVGKFSGGWAIGRHVYDFDGLGKLAINAWHQDQVIEPPAGARTIASSDFCRHAALAYGDHILTVQPHPEFSSPLIGKYLHLRRGQPGFPDDVMDEAARHLGEPTDNARLGTEIAHFFLKHDRKHNDEAPNG